MQDPKDNEERSPEELLASIAGLMREIKTELESVSLSGEELERLADELRGVYGADDSEARAPEAPDPQS